MIVVVGPTAIGKTPLCVQLAKEFHTEIISADARQCYKMMNIGTAKPSIETMEGIKHHFIDFLPIQASYNASRFAQAALQKIQALFKTHRYVILVGGAGLYIQAVCEGFDTMPQVNNTIRENLNQECNQFGLATLVEELAIKDPVYYQEADLKNPQRIVRALGVCRATGRPYSFFRKKKAIEFPFKIITIGLTCSREELYERIDQRADQMVAQGLFEEAEALYPLRHYAALQTIGYQEIFNYIEGHYDKVEAVKLFKKNSQKYAKRQLTWFKKNKNVVWFHPAKFYLIKTYIKHYVDV